MHMQTLFFMRWIIIHCFIYMLSLHVCYCQSDIKAEFFYQIQREDTTFKRIKLYRIDSITPQTTDIQFQQNGVDIRQLTNKSIVKKGSQIIDKKVTVQGLDTTTTRQVCLLTNGQITNRQLYDRYDEVVKEDTMTFDATGNLVAKCSYDYRNNTSLYCDDYCYKKGKLKKWRTFFHWNTISLSGKVIEKRGKRRHYVYAYAKDSLIRVNGFYYNTRLHRRIKRNQHGIQLDIQTKKRKVKDAKTSKYSIEKEIIQKNFANGRLVAYEKRVNDVVRNKITYEYTPDNKIIRSTTWHGTRVFKQKIYFYSKDQLDSLIEKRFRKDESLSYMVITHFNKQQQIIRETQQNEQRKLTQLSISYNGNKPIERRFILGDGTTININAFIYQKDVIEKWLTKAGLPNSLDQLLKGDL